MTYVIGSACVDVVDKSCVQDCPADCIYMGSTYDISCYTRDGCVVDYAKLPLEVAWGQDTLNPTAVHASKRVSLPVWTKAGSEKPAEPPATATA